MLDHLRRKYKVVALSVAGRRNKVYKVHDVVYETDFPHGVAEQLVKKGFLNPIGPVYEEPHVRGQYGNNILHHCKSQLTVEEIDSIYSRAVITDTITDKRYKKEVVLSVVIPYFRAGYIGWLPLESLIRQRGVDFSWELIIMEENIDNPYGLKQILQYKSALKKAGCHRIRYVQLNEWIPLSAKWHYLIKETDSTSKVICFNSADVYCGKDRLSKQYKVLSEGKHNWYKLGGNLVYDIQEDKHVKLTSIARNKADTACRATTKELALKLPLANVKKSVDGWTYNTLLKTGISFYYDDSNMWKDTINVNGLNNITLGRGRRIRQVSHPFSGCCGTLKNHIPEEVVKKLQHSMKYLGNHKHVRVNSKVKL